MRTRASKRVNLLAECCEGPRIYLHARVYICRVYIIYMHTRISVIYYLLFITLDVEIRAACSRNSATLSLYREEKSVTRKKKRAYRSDLGGKLQARDTRTVDPSSVRRHKVVRRLGTINLRASEETGQFPTRYDEISQSCGKGTDSPWINRNPRPIEVSWLPDTIRTSRLHACESYTYRCHVVGARSRNCVERNGNLVGQ